VVAATSGRAVAIVEAVRTPIGRGKPHVAEEVQDTYGRAWTPELLEKHDVRGQGLGAELIAEEYGIGRLAALEALPPAFEPDGKITAGSSSQISDGAAAVLLMSLAKANELGPQAPGAHRRSRRRRLRPAQKGMFAGRTMTSLTIAFGGRPSA
jgi:acetyl-CoA acetyltransferase